MLCQKGQPKTRKFTWEEGRTIVIAQNRRTGEVGVDADSGQGKEGKGVVGRERKEDIRSKTNKGVRSLPHVRREFRKASTVKTENDGGYVFSTTCKDYNKQCQTGLAHA